MSIQKRTEPLKVFLSYSHADESLKNQLDKHLSALKRSNQIETWSDRRIEPGEDWRKEIDQNLLASDIILLLISADFLSSDFCYNIETLNAIDRHNRGTAVVIPIVLREVVFKGLPIEDLQMLPKDAKAVVSQYWHSQDEAFKNVAEGVGKAVETFLDYRSTRIAYEAQPHVELESRALDAAIARTIHVDEIHEVVAMVRITDSQGLVRVLQPNVSSGSQYSCVSSDIRSEEFKAKYQIINRIMTAPPYRLTIDAPGLVSNDLAKPYEMEWGQDSIAFKFFVKAPKPGEHRLRVNLYAKDSVAAELLTRTNAGSGPTPGTGPAGGILKLVASVRLMLDVVYKRAVVGGF